MVRWAALRASSTKTAMLERASVGFLADRAIHQFPRHTSKVYRETLWPSRRW
jgi:hypothetical protein